MNITDVRVRKVAKEGKMKAVVSITIDDEFVVHDIKVIEGEKGLFIAMPSRKATDGEYRDIAHPINSTTRTEIQNIILTKYEETIVQEEAEAEIASYLDSLRTWTEQCNQSEMTPLLLKLPDLLCVNLSIINSIGRMPSQMRRHSFIRSMSSDDALLGMEFL